MLFEEKIHDFLSWTEKHRAVYFLALARNIRLPDDTELAQRPQEYNKACDKGNYLYDHDITHNGTWTYEHTPAWCKIRKDSTWRHASVLRPYLAARKRLVTEENIAMHVDFIARGYLHLQTGPVSSVRLPFDPARLQQNMLKDLIKPNNEWTQKFFVAQPEHVVTDNPTPLVARSKATAQTKLHKRRVLAVHNTKEGHAWVEKQ